MKVFEFALSDGTVEVVRATTYTKALIAFLQGRTKRIRRAIKKLS